MNAISTPRHLHKSLIAPLAVAGLLLSAACADNDDPEGAEDTNDTPEEPAEDTEDADDTDEEPTDDDDDDDDEAADGADGADSDEESSEDDMITMAEVEDNDTADSCWAVMEDTVYDLTDWIDQHPGGEERIEQLCGTNATEAFDDQHGGSDRPESQLSEFEIGSLQS